MISPEEAEIRKKRQLEVVANERRWHQRAALFFWAGVFISPIPVVCVSVVLAIQRTPWYMLGLLLTPLPSFVSWKIMGHYIRLETAMAPYRKCPKCLAIVTHDGTWCNHVHCFCKKDFDWFEAEVVELI